MTWHAGSAREVRREKDVRKCNPEWEARPILLRPIPESGSWESCDPVSEIRGFHFSDKWLDHR